MEGMLHGVLFCPLNRGQSGAARIGGGERSEPVSRIVFMSFDTESKLRNADFISIAAERQSATLGAKGPVKLKNPWARKGPSILRTFFHNPSTQPAAPAAPPLYCGEAATTTFSLKDCQT